MRALALFRSKPAGVVSPSEPFNAAKSLGNVPAPESQRNTWTVLLPMVTFQMKPRINMSPRIKNPKCGCLSGQPSNVVLNVWDVYTFVEISRVSASAFRRLVCFVANLLAQSLPPRLFNNLRKFQNISRSQGKKKHNCQFGDAPLAPKPTREP